MYFNESNKESFRLSIIEILNSSDYKSRINEELIISFIDEILENELNKVDAESRLFNPIVVKLSKDRQLFNKYISKVIKLDHETYLLKVKQIIKQKEEKIYNYAIDNIDIIDFSNEIETYILERYANHILSTKLFHLVEQKWFIKYIIYSSTNLKPNVIGYSFSYYLKKKNKNLNFKLYKKNNYFLYKDFPVIDPFNNTIYINLGLFKVISDSKSFEVGLLYLLNNCFKYLTKIIKRNKEFSITYDLEMYRFIKEEIIYKEDSNYYSKNHDYFDSTIGINEESQKMVFDLLLNPLFSNLKISKFNKYDYNQFKNSSMYYNVDDYIDKLIYSAPSIIDDYPMLQMEYNANGNRKSIKELIDLKHKKINMFNEQIIEFRKIIDQSKDLKEKIESKLKLIESGLPGVIMCHNNMIYKSIKKYDVKTFKDVLTRFSDEYKKDMLEAIMQEKEVFIEKLQSNRKRIFKLTTFLENDEFLSNEYSIAATYESVLKNN